MNVSPKNIMKHNDLSWCTCRSHKYILYGIMFQKHQTYNWLESVKILFIKGKQLRYVYIHALCSNNNFYIRSTSISFHVFNHWYIHTMLFLILEDFCELFSIAHIYYWTRAITSLDKWQQVDHPKWYVCCNCWWSATGSNYDCSL